MKKHLIFLSFLVLSGLSMNVLNTFAMEKDPSQMSVSAKLAQFNNSGSTEQKNSDKKIEKELHDKLLKSSPIIEKNNKDRKYYLLNENNRIANLSRKEAVNAAHIYEVYTTNKEKINKDENFVVQGIIDLKNEDILKNVDISIIAEAFFNLAK